MRTRIKVCGITDIITAENAVDAGVDALGFIFAPNSPRMISPEDARNIIAVLPPFVDAVGVFVNEYLEVVDEIIHFCRFTAVQLHGAETPEYCGKISPRVLKAFKLPKNAESGPPIDYHPYIPVVGGFLLDTYKKDAEGGTGETFDWNLIDQNRPPGPIYLAGGLTPANVCEAILHIRPFAVDVNSGVETAPGKKDIQLIREFVDKVKQADQKLASRL